MPTLLPGSSASATPHTDARRLHRPRWTHPRAVTGAALVAVCMLLGGLLVTNVAKTTEVWAVSADVRAGEPVRPGDLERVDVRLDRVAAGAYLDEPDTDSLSDRLSGAAWARDLAAGELVPVAAVAGETVVSGVEVPLQVTGTAMPADLGPGHRVDVWVAAEQPSAGTRSEAARRVIDDVAVVAVHGDGSAFGEGSVRSVVVLVEDERGEVLPRALAALAGGSATLVRRMGPSA
ncbi:SAF domain-containing protein [Mumia sp. zg.B17]|uniref:SAF domain-containing protein n=1 Tax=Mumia sp. zg.B17 TaxID=2855446 RepID=UPI001C6EFA8D|nr:SAF domain-containing protein [Mumia sp. zg.B17]MBW9204895.1 SAF domain-containing protein [Mumia sp. zg.B17]